MRFNPTLASFKTPNMYFRAEGCRVIFSGKKSCRFDSYENAGATSTPIPQLALLRSFSRPVGLTTKLIRNLPEPKSQGYLSENILPQQLAPFRILESIEEGYHKFDSYIPCHYGEWSW